MWMEMSEVLKTQVYADFGTLFQNLLCGVGVCMYEKENFLK